MIGALRFVLGGRICCGVAGFVLMVRVGCNAYAQTRYVLARFASSGRCFGSAGYAMPTEQSP